MSTRFLFGAVYYQAGELETARSWFGRYLRANPDNLQAQKLMAATLLRLQATDEAVALLERAREEQLGGSGKGCVLGKACPLRPSENTAP